jgi:hypothetical protein
MLGEPTMLDSFLLASLDWVELASAELDTLFFLYLEEKYYNKTYGKKGKENMDRVKAALCDPGTKRINLNFPY